MGTTNILSKAKTKLKVSAQRSLSQTAPSSSSVLRLTNAQLRSQHPLGEALHISQRLSFLFSQFLLMFRILEKSP